MFVWQYKFYGKKYERKAQKCSDRDLNPGLWLSLFQRQMALKT